MSSQTQHFYYFPYYYMCSVPPPSLPVGGGGGVSYRDMRRSFNSTENFYVMSRQKEREKKKRERISFYT